VSYATHAGYIQSGNIATFVAKGGSNYVLGSITDSSCNV
jgi:hypothetical protein